MSFGIYKQGQGYWVRTMTAVFAGVLFLVGAAWAWNQAQSFDPPIKGYTLTLNVSGEGGLQPDAIVVIERPGSDGTAQRLATALVERYAPAEAGRGVLVIRNVRFEGSAGSIPREARVRADDPSVDFAGQILGREAIELIPRLYIQASVAGVIILIGAVSIYWLVGVKPQTVDFLIATDGEMKKVNWSTRKEIIGSTQVVIVAAVLIASILFVIDLAFSNFFKLIGVLEG